MADVGGLPGSKTSRYPASGLSMAQVADQLAIAVGTQWDAEAAMSPPERPLPAAGLLGCGGPIPDRPLGLAGEAGD